MTDNIGQSESTAAPKTLHRQVYSPLSGGVRLPSIADGKAASGRRRSSVSSAGARQSPRTMPLPAAAVRSWAQAELPGPHSRHEQGRGRQEGPVRFLLQPQPVEKSRPVLGSRLVLRGKTGCRRPGGHRWQHRGRPGPLPRSPRQRPRPAVRRTPGSAAIFRGFQARVVTVWPRRASAAMRKPACPLSSVMPRESGASSMLQRLGLCSAVSGIPGCPVPPAQRRRRGQASRARALAPAEAASRGNDTKMRFRTSRLSPVRPRPAVRSRTAPRRGRDRRKTPSDWRRHRAAGSPSRRRDCRTRGRA
jgi:hypothetical protein